MRRHIPWSLVLSVIALFAGACGGAAPDPAPAAEGTEEFGLTQRELVQAVERVEALIARCMREQGFTYIPVDYATVRRGMAADKAIPGVGEEEFVGRYGFGVSTLYAGLPPQLNDGYSPARIGLGERNVEIFRQLPPADQVAYNRALAGENPDATFAVGLETEDLSRCGGCTRAAIAQVFRPEQLQATYYNPKDALVNNDPRMKAALRHWATEMRKAGFNYQHPDEIESDIRERLMALTEGGTTPLATMPPDQQAALEELQRYELSVAAKYFELKTTLFDPLEAKIQREMFAREVK